MAHNSADDEKKAPKRVIKNPLLFTLAVQLLVVSSVLALLNVVDPLWVSSFFWGAVVYIVPNAYFTYYAFRYRDTQHSQEIARSFYSGEFGKQALAAVGFALVFHYIPALHPIALFAGFVSLIVLQLIIADQLSKT